MTLLAGIAIAFGLIVLGAQIENGLLALARSFKDMAEALGRFIYHYERKP